MNKSSKPTIFLPVLFGLMALPLSSHAGIKCWTNKEGVRECGNMVPPEYAQQETRTINKRGITTEVKERAKSRDEIEAERVQQKEEERHSAEEEKRRKEQEIYDRVLLATFLNEEDIIRSRDRKLSAIDATIELTRITRDKLQEKLSKEEASAAKFAAQGRQVPTSIQTDVDSLRKQIDDKENHIDSKVRERQALFEKYAADLERFRELKTEGRKLR